LLAASAFLTGAYAHLGKDMLRFARHAAPVLFFGRHLAI
jgi:hypothetical protein